MSGKSLVICEKPSVAREVASAIGARRVGSHYEGGRWVVCALLGRVAELKKPSAYRRWESWDLETLPMVPAKFELVASDGEAAGRCFSELRSLLARKDVTEVVHACDPDREGEGIARRALALLGCRLPVRRLWCSSLEPEDQARMARLVTVRLACSLMPDGSDDVCRIEGTCAGVALSATVSEAAVAGWREARDAALGRPPRDKDGQGTREAEGRVPEDVREGSELELSEACLHEGKTRPPAAYTDATLLSAMEGAARLVDDAGAARALRGSESHAGGLGTPATRADTIERLESYGYVSRDGKSLAATKLGLAVDSLVPEAVATPALTGRWEEDLARVEAGALPVSDFEASVASTLPGLVSDALAHPVPPCPDALGTCPRCGQGSVVLSKSGKVAYCDTRRGHMEDGSFVVDSGGCGYRLSPSVFGHRMTETQLRQLLSSGRVALRGVTTPKGARVSAVLVDAGAEWGTRLEFASRPGPRRGGRGHGSR